MEICIENLSAYRDEKLTPKMVRRILGIDNREIAELCRQVSLIPKRDSKGQTYFSREDVDVLQKMKQLHSKTSEKEVRANVIDYLPQVGKRQQIENSIMPVAVEPETSLCNSFANIEESLVSKISKVIDEKLDGMDEVVVELIRCKTENETLRQKVNELNKLTYKMKKELNSYRSIGFNLFVKQNVENLD